jgi:glycosyltransferase involved in cell wall biosynthesis
MEKLPMISIITPSYNQGIFIEETIKSVLGQGYPNLQYIIIDGGSMDGTLEIIRKYEGHLAYWVSEPDKGQYHAINKGFERADGEIIGWLCSDDTYLPGALDYVGKIFDEQAQINVLLGGWNYIDEAGKLLWTEYARYHQRELALGAGRIGQPATFWRRRVYERLGPISEEFQHCMDGEYFLRMGQFFEFYPVKKVLANYRLHQNSKTVAEHRKMQEAWEVIARRYGAEFSLNPWKRLFQLRYQVAKNRHRLAKLKSMIQCGTLIKYLARKYRKFDNSF